MKNKTKIFVLALCGSLVFAASGCMKQETSKASTVENSPPPIIANAPAPNAEIAAAQRAIETLPQSPLGYNKLAIAFIRRARETGDFNLNSNALAAADRALEIEPANYEAKKLKATLFLTFHRFPEALELGKQLAQENPRDAVIYGVLTDANAELGNYQEALDAVQKMVDTRPNLESYARVAQMRSLHGLSDGAIEAMSTAYRIAGPGEKEAQSWCLTQLGNEFFKTGKRHEAEKHFDEALKILPDYHLAVAGKAHARAAAGDYENAAKLFAQTAARVPSAEVVIALGDVYAKMGETEKAAEQYKLAEFIEQKLGNLDQRRLALMWADQNVRLDEALEIARRERQTKQDIFTCDVLAWTLYKKGLLKEAKTAINEAMRLKTQDARLFYHAGMIEKDLGNKQAARTLLKKALATNPAFDLRQAENLEKAIKEL